MKHENESNGSSHRNGPHAEEQGHQLPSWFERDGTNTSYRTHFLVYLRSNAMLCAGLLKAKVAKLRRELISPSGGGGAKEEGTILSVLLS